MGLDSTQELAVFGQDRLTVSIQPSISSTISMPQSGEIS